MNIMERDISKKGVQIALADSFPTPRGRGVAPLKPICILRCTSPFQTFTCLKYVSF